MFSHLVRARSRGSGATSRRGRAIVCSGVAIIAYSQGAKLHKTPASRLCPPMPNTPLPFSFPKVGSETGLRLKTRIGSLTLASCADVNVRLRPEEWPEGLAQHVDDRLDARNGLDKGRVFYVWSPAVGGETPVACCAWHLHKGDWPLCVLDAGWALVVDDKRGKALVERVLFAALRALATRSKVQDTQVPRPSKALGWHVNHQAGAGDLALRKDWAKAAATRAQRDFAFPRLTKGQRPHWARDGFYGERLFNQSRTGRRR